MTRPIIKLASILWACAAAAIAESPPQGPWLAGWQGFVIDGEAVTRANVGGGAVDTENQRLQGEVNVSVHKLMARENSPMDYYALAGNFRHGVLHPTVNYNNATRSAYEPYNNAVSVGYYGTVMTLNITGLTPGARIYESAPKSTVGSETEGFHMGGNLSGMVGDQSGVSAGINAGFSVSHTHPSVQTTHAVDDPEVRWVVTLPGVGHQGGGLPPNPYGASFAGYEFEFGAIFEVPKGAAFEAEVFPRVEWAFDYTRGLRNHDAMWEAIRTIDWVPPDS